jgi:hypothetical protein
MWYTVMARGARALEYSGIVRGAEAMTMVLRMQEPKHRYFRYYPLLARQQEERA